MKKFLSLIVAAFAFFGANSAYAQTFVTTPGTYTFAGSGVLVQKGSGPLLSCFLSIDITNSGGVLTADNPVLTGSLGFCDTVQFQNTPWTVSVSGTTVSFSTVYADTTITPGDCQGVLTATFVSGTPETLNVATSLPEVTSGGACTINGSITWP